MWTSNRTFELIDLVLELDECSELMLIRCVNMTLLCVQENAEDRPTMSDVVSPLPPPNQAIFQHLRNNVIPRSSINKSSKMVYQNRNALNFRSQVIVKIDFHDVQIISIQ